MSDIYNYVDACYNLAIEHGSAAKALFWIALSTTCLVWGYNVGELIRWSLYKVFGDKED